MRNEHLPYHTLVPLNFITVVSPVVLAVALEYYKWDKNTHNTHKTSIWVREVTFATSPSMYTEWPSKQGITVYCTALHTEGLLLLTFSFRKPKAANTTPDPDACNTSCQWTATKSIHPGCGSMVGMVSFTCIRAVCYSPVKITLDADGKLLLQPSSTSVFCTHFHLYW